MVLDASMDIGTDHRSYSDVDSTVNTNDTLFEFHHMTALGLGILAMLAIGGAYAAFRIHRQNVFRVKKRHQLAITYLGKRQRHLTDASEYYAEEGQGRSFRGNRGSSAGRRGSSGSMYTYPPKK
jgi:hypothetical protein